MRVLFLIEDISFEFDSRVKREADTLTTLGVEVIVICPATQSDAKTFYELNGIKIYQYHVNQTGYGILSHVREYTCSLVRQTWLSAKVFWKHGFSAIHIGNHSDLFWSVALPYKLLGKKIVYDQHDPIAELFDVRFGNRLPILGRIVRLFEKIGMGIADHVVAINESCRESILGKVKKHSSQVTVVRNGPRKSDYDVIDVEPDPGIKNLGKIVVGYLGHMNAQDNVDVFIEMARIIRKDENREDIGFVMIGSGTNWNRLKDMRDQFGLSDAVSMPGRLPWKRVLSILKATDICIQPDLPNDFNHKVTMNKLMEYMILGKPTVAFRLKETVVTGGNAAVYCEFPTAASMAKEVIHLADNRKKRQQIGNAGKKRIDDIFGWQHQESNLVSAYQKLFPELISSRT